jgi:two-component system, NarL family, response regulator NreC
MILLKLKVLLADDHEIYLDGLQAMLQKQADIEVVGLAANGQECIRLAGDLQPDIILTDIMMPVMDGITSTKYLTEHFPRVSIIALSMFDQDNLIIDMLEAGAKGYLLKNAHKSEIMEAIHSVYKNIPYYCRSTTTRLARLIGQSRYNPKQLKEFISFSDREKEIIRLICEEKTTKEIAEQLFMGSRTVEGYRIKILEKMQVHGVAGIVIYAIKHRLFEVK